jgi:hypothetical protein
MPSAFPFWARCLSHLHLSTLRRFHRFLFVSIGHRDSRSSTVWLAEAGTLSTGFTPQGVPRLDACCVPLTPLSTRSSL